MADANAKGALGNTALIWATFRGRLDIICMILPHERVDACVRNKAGPTALDIARRLEIFDIVECLEEHANAALRRRERKR